MADHGSNVISAAAFLYDFPEQNRTEHFSSANSFHLSIFRNTCQRLGDDASIFLSRSLLAVSLAQRYETVRRLHGDNFG